jgi:hypothetical protein
MTTDITPPPLGPSQGRMGHAGRAAREKTQLIALKLGLCCNKCEVNDDE